MSSFAACAAIDDTAFRLLLPTGTAPSDNGGRYAIVGVGFVDGPALLLVPLLSVVGGVLHLDDDLLVVVTIADETVCSSPSNPSGVVMADAIAFVV